MMTLDHSRQLTAFFAIVILCRFRGGPEICSWMRCDRVGGYEAMRKLNCRCPGISYRSRQYGVIADLGKR